MLLEWSGYSSEQHREQTSFISQAIGEQHFPRDRTTVLFYYQKLTSIHRFEHAAHKARCVTTTMLDHYATAVALLLCTHENIVGQPLSQLVCNRANSSGKGPADLENIKKKD